MTPERFRRLEVLYDAVVEMDPEARARYIEEQCAGDNEMRRELLAAFDDDSHGLLQNAVEQAARSIAQQAEWHKDQDTNTRVRPDGLPPTLQLAPRGDVAGLEGRRVGQYQVLRLLGRGGMGDVYLAQRADNAFHKQVALKVIRAEVSSSEVVRRFRQEREILAALDHPNVARLLDGGTTDEGWPYFVMEYVEGSPIDQYSDEHKLTVTARLRLFQNVCAAVEYAHQHLIVHRDLKPSNILVTEDGTVKLLDFGIAKLLRTQGEETVYVTRAGTHLMTPEYASPEQVKGETITTATDVYSLGVVLYELLTGHRPYRMRSRALHEIARIICEEEPSRPSTVISRVEQVDTSGQEPTTITPEYVSQVRNVQVTKLKKRLSGDLDTILLLALRKEPQRRYSSVEQLREDLERHVAGLPVRAQIDSLWYRTRKFVQRNRLGVAAAATLGTALIAMGASLWRAQEEQIRAAALQEELTYANRRLGIDQRGATKRHVVRMIPPGWVSPADNGDFAIRLDRKITHSGQSALLIQADGDIRRPEVVSQTIRADHYLGERVRWSAYAKCEGVTQAAALWLRVDAKDRTLAMDDLQRVPIVGTRDWQQYAVVLDVPKDSVVIRLGLLLVGKGKVWFDDLKLETVGPEVRVTDIWRWADPAYKKEANLALRRHSLTQEELDNLPGQPINLQWE